MIDPKKLKELFDYEPSTGVLVWKSQMNAKATKGSVVGAIHKSGYRVTLINKKNYMVHRLIWAFVHGKYPRQIDHVNGCRSDNRIENLRECTSSQNGANKGLQSNNRTGFKGVSYSSRARKYQATCRVNGVKKWIGYFATAEQASEAYQNFAKENHGAFYKGNV